VTGLGRSLAVAGATVAVLTLAPAAQGSTLARIAGDAVIFTADSGETNGLTVGFVPGSPGTHTFSDPGNPIDTTFDGPGNCENVTTDTASCPAAAGDAVIADLGDEGDTGISTASVGTSFCGGPGEDDLTGASGDDFLLGEGGHDTMAGGGGADFVITEVQVCDAGPTEQPASNDAGGGEGNDGLIGGLGADSMTGGDGDDTMYGARVEDGVTGDAGDQLSGDDGEDTLVGHDGGDTLDGGAQADMIVGGEGEDELLGGEGDDLLGITVNQVFTNQGNKGQVITRDPGADRLDGGAGDDRLNGGPGDFVLNFGGEDALDATEVGEPNGPDEFTGGPGRDTVTYVNLALAVTATPDGVADDGSAGEGDNIHTDNEVLVGGSAADTLIGGGLDDTLDGGKDGDRIAGGGGSDVLNGGAADSGADNIAGGGGPDSLDGGPGDDSLDGQAGTDVVGGGDGSDAAAGGDEADSVSGGAGLDTLFGGTGDDRLLGAGEGVIGADGADSLHGDAGNDDLDGGPADDNLAGGPGADTMGGAAGLDTADYGGASGPVTARLDGAAGDGERLEGDHIRGDVEGLRGGRAPDTLIGGAAANVIDGAGGQDYIDGAGGPDRLQGGRGADAVRSRDGRPDRVSCGASRDFAIADGRDTVRGDCERADLGGRRRPVLGRSMVARPVRGSNQVRVSGMRRFIPFGDILRLPLGSSLDAGSGVVRVITAGSRHTGTFSGGRFGVRQRRRRHAPTLLRLEGGRFRGCSGSRVVRRLRGRTRGTFRISARRSTTAVRRGRWSVADRCDGTLTRVLGGRALVLDRSRHRRVTLRGGRSYLARAR
jgi:Ca2+-binding RTX toxin-like protein